MKIKIEKLRENIEFRNHINSVDLSDIELIDENGDTVDPSKLDISADEWKFTGLSNFDFVRALSEV